MMQVDTARFGVLDIQESDIISFPQGIFGFLEHKEFCLVDPSDETLILWLQSLKDRDLVLPVLEPRVFTQYKFKLAATDMKDLSLESLERAAVFSILTIPSDVKLMTANLKAPIVINLQAQIGKQVVLQDNEQPIQFPMFKELRAHLMTIQGQNRNKAISAVSVRSLQPALLG